MTFTFQKEWKRKEKDVMSHFTKEFVLKYAKNLKILVQNRSTSLCKVRKKTGIAHGDGMMQLTYAWETIFSYFSYFYFFLINFYTT